MLCLSSTFKLLENQAEPEEQQPRKKRKKVESSTKASAKDTKAKLFEEHLEW